MALVSLAVRLASRRRPLLGRLTLVLLMAAGAAACGGDGGGDVPLAGLEGLTIEPLRSAVGVGGTERFRAVGHYADGTTRDVSAAVTWSIPIADGVARIDADGVATGLALGSATITAVQPSSGLTAAAFLEVERFGREGRADAPLPLPLEEPHAGQVNTGLSHYVFEVDPGRHYYVFLTDATDELELAAYDDAERTRVLCDPSSSQLDLTCVTEPAPRGDRLWVVVDGVWTDTFFGGEGGAEFTLRVVPGWVDEGTSTEPVELAQGVARDGMVGTYSSYYSVPATYGAEYTLTLAGLTDDANLSVSGASGFWATRCSPGLEGTADEQCVLRADGDHIPIQVFGTRTEVGAAFTLEVQETDSPLAAEGTPAAPIELTGRLPWSGQVVDGASYYAYDVDPGRSYQVRLEDAEGEVWMDVFDDDPTFTSYDCADSTGFLGEEVALCEITPATGSRLYVRVRGDQPLGVRYRIVIEPIGYVAEGVEGPLTLGAPPLEHAGQVDLGVSRYEVPVVPGVLYEVEVTNLVNDVALGVYDDAGFVTLLCASDLAGTVDEACVTETRPSGDRMWIAVDGAASGFGSSYRLAVSRLWESEGTQAAPVPLEADAPRTSQVGPDAPSWYRIPGDAGRSYAVVADANTDDVFFNVYDGTAAATGTGRCSSWAPARCEVRPAEAGSLLIRVSSSYTTHGAGFVLEVSGVPYVPEGTASSPVDLGPAPVIHAGQTDATASHYRVGTEPGVVYEVALSGRAVTADLRVYDDAGFTTALCAAATAGVAEERCLATPTGPSLWVKADGAASGFGGLYELSVQRHYVSEGAVATHPKDPGPVPVTVGVPYAGQVSDEAASYYQAAVTPGAGYTVSLSGLTGEVYLYVYDADGTFTSSVWRDDSAGLGDKIVTVPAAGGDVLYFKAVTRYGVAGSVYTVRVE